ncbi:MAG: nitroreductase family protein [Chloroflexota bacterium]
MLVDRSEFLVYRLLRNGLEAADSFCHDMKAGDAAQNVYLQEEALDLRTVFIGVFHDRQVQDVLQFPDAELPLALLPVGRPVVGERGCNGASSAVY